MPLFLTERDVKEILTMEIALEEVEKSFFLLTQGQNVNSPRHRLSVPSGHLNFMTASAPDSGAIGHKTYAAIRGQAIPFYIDLYDSSTGKLISLIEASYLGQIRTGAATGVATKYMSREESETVAIIGSGYQARTQLEAVCKVRNIKSARVYSRNEDKREKYAKRMTEKLGIPVEAYKDGRSCVNGADIVITITSSPRPVLEGEWLSSGTHINAAGGNHWMRREIDDEVIIKSDPIVVDDIEQAKIECGDILSAIEKGNTGWQHVRNFSEIVNGTYDGRPDKESITLFESQGLAIQDVCVGKAVYEAALNLGIGQKIFSD